MNVDAPLIQAKIPHVRKGRPQADIHFLSNKTAEEVRAFHRTVSQYAVTPLHELRGLARRLGLASVLVKDESFRFGLNAFKALGGVYAMGKYVAGKLSLDLAETSFEWLRSEEARERIGGITFVTATDGNHGRGVAWAAKQLGQKAVIYMPKGSSLSRLSNIRREGAEASIIDGNYDDAVRLAAKMAEENGWVLVQDTAWEGYQDIPTWIMQGYVTIIHETLEQLGGHGIEKPTHVFLQAGVGSLAGAILGYLLNRFGDDRPVTIIVEPDHANCHFLSSLSGKREIVTGDMPTIMAGLACGTPSELSFDILMDYADVFLSCPDYVAARGMRVLAAPLKGDPQVVSGESGAGVGVGALTLVTERDGYRDLREALRFDETSVVLVINTEGDTDPRRYRNIVWEGDYCSGRR